jgi:hypothetical protein
MAFSLEQALIEVWRQTLVENAKTVELGSERFPVRRTPKKGSELHSRILVLDRLFSAIFSLMISGSTIPLDRP